MEQKIFIFISRDQGDWKSFSQKYELTDYCTSTENISLDDQSSYHVRYLSEKKDVFVLHKKDAVDRPLIYLGGEDTMKVITTAQNIINKCKKYNLNDNIKIVFCVHWGGEDAMQRKPHLALNVELKNKKIDDFRFASFTGSFYTEYRDLNMLKNHLLSQAEENVINSFNLEIQKKKIINLWLPLAIDIQGLKDLAQKEKIDDISQIGNEHQLNKYYNEIRDDIKNYQVAMEEWNKIKSSIDDNELPQEILSDIKNDLTLSDFCKEYINNDKKFFPRWLQKVVKTLDEKVTCCN